MQFIVATDGSEQSERALEYALDLAATTDAAVAVVYAVDPAVREYAADAPVASFADAENHLVIEDEGDAEARGEYVLGRAREYARERGLDVETELLYGDPVESVTELASRRDADAIFVGHRGMTPQYEGLVGSVAAGLVERATVPVTVVR
ncbi:universal stress protein [Halomarina halobia]|uniref:Universal stress protein n=1 Tax=Halomarina halobia TaxID=3033386 RepID=A0ABD6A718_9EURY|nr:universal stress protein [Halomarina sp. PSR21]